MGGRGEATEHGVAGRGRGVGGRGRGVGGRGRGVGGRGQDQEGVKGRRQVKIGRGGIQSNENEDGPCQGEAEGSRVGAGVKMKSKRIKENRPLRKENKKRS